MHSFCQGTLKSLKNYNFTFMRRRAAHSLQYSGMTLMGIPSVVRVWIFLESHNVHTVHVFLKLLVQSVEQAGGH